MIIELVSTGSELLLGDVVNTNAPWMSKELNAMGYDVAYQSTVGDNRVRMEETFQHAAQRSDIVVVTGGLGPTQGDITREVLACAFDLGLERNEDALTMVNDFFTQRGRSMPSGSVREAMLPVGSTILANPVGVAPGVVLEVQDTVFILLPGPPEEARGMFTSEVVPLLNRLYGAQGSIVSHHVYAYGIPEVKLEALLMDLVENQHNPTIAFLVKTGYTEVRLTAKSGTPEGARKLLEPWIKIVEDRLGDAIGRDGDSTMLNTAITSIQAMQATIGSAESCTGGLIGAAFTSMAGSSEYYMGGIISYSNAVKESVLGVSADTLRIHGAVSEEVAQEMAEGAKRVLKTDYAISTTGIAGPGGATDTKPVGLVYIGISGPHGIQVYKNNFIGDRDAVRARTVEMALYGLHRMLAEDAQRTPAK